MRILLDTHTLLWFLENNAKLHIAMRERIEDAATEPFVSIGSLWEIAVKVNTGKLPLHVPFETFIERISASAINLLPVLPAHLAIVARLPLHHKDPFDRMIVAQALVENLPLVSVDEMFDVYGVTRIW